MKLIYYLLIIFFLGLVFGLSDKSEVGVVEAASWSQIRPTTTPAYRPPRQVRTNVCGQGWCFVEKKHKRFGK